MGKVALGKGLGALINTRVASPTPAVEQGERVQQVSLDQIVASPLQPRTHFSEETINELVDSIKQHG
ncbi:MAG: ParB N-terminal domain-containing protein, partial [Verrucomicrobiota bacterium]|nr:ParB N-terminal domain-containing protein [Verrucomicrobiota bacterium]